MPLDNYNSNLYNLAAKLAKANKKKPKSKEKPKIHMKTVLSIADSKELISVKMPSELCVVTVEGLNVGVPIQVQLEIMPSKSLGYTMCTGKTVEVSLANIIDMKARVKPGSIAFGAEEQKLLDHIVNDTEDKAQVKKRKVQLAKKIKKAEQDQNRFTGLEIDSE